MLSMRWVVPSRPATSSRAGPRVDVQRGAAQLPVVHREPTVPVRPAVEYRPRGVEHSGQAVQGRDGARRQRAVLK